MMKENEIRPQDLFQRYLKLCEIDAVSYFDPKDRKDIPCPACECWDVTFAFEKSKFSYVVCNACGTLYQSPRHREESFNKFYTDSPSSEYWAKTFFPAVAEKRREKLFKPKVKQIADLCHKDGFIPKVLADIGAGYGLFLEEWRKEFPDTKLIAVEPNHDLAEKCRQKGIDVAGCFADEAKHLKGKVDLTIAFEVVEHVYDPLTFFSSIRDLLRDNGKALFTGLTVDGFDIQVLWERSNSVFPPHHINFISIKGFECLLRRAGFSDIDIFTPGKLDVDIVKNALVGDPGILKNDRFLKKLLEKEDEVLENFQKFLSENKLSSHCWVWATK